MHVCRTRMRCVLLHHLELSWGGTYLLRSFSTSAYLVYMLSSWIPRTVVPGMLYAARLL